MIAVSCLQLVLGKEFEADRVYLPVHGDAVYEDEVKGLVCSMYDGINATVFAYGKLRTLHAAAARVLPVTRH